MAHLAEIRDGVVVRVIVALDEYPGRLTPEQWAASKLGGTWVRTSYRTRAGVHPDGEPIRKNYAGVGYAYDAGRDAFIPPKPFDSWVLNETTCLWEAPTPMPDDGAEYVWHEPSRRWRKV